MRLAQHAWRLLLSVAGVLGISYIGVAWIPVNAMTAGFALLLFILAIASTWGFIEASVSSIAATLVFNFFFLPPVGTFTVADPQNWIALFTFLATSLIASRLSDTAKRRTRDAVERQQDVERLYTLGRAILLINDEEPIARQLIRRLADTFELRAAALYDPHTGAIYRAGPVEFEGMDSELQEAARQGISFTFPETNRVITAVRLGSEPVASLGLEGPQMRDSVIQSIANLIAIGLERAKAQNLANEVEASRRSDRIRTTLMDAMAHEFKTPLTSIRAATSALLANPDGINANAGRMLKIADEEAARLEELIDNSLETAKLDTDHIDVDWKVSNFSEAIREVVASTQLKTPDRELDFTPDTDTYPAAFDQRLIKLAVKQLLDNALKYSSAATPVQVRAFRENATVVAEITDHGKGIAPQEQARIFDRFYRSPSVHDRIPGSGLGLSIANRIVQAHGGSLTVKSRPGETTFRMTLPTEHGEKT